MSLSLKSLKSKSMKLMNNDLLTNLVIFITLALLVSYLSKHQYEAVIILLLISGVVFLLGKNLLYALVIGIILTNLLISSRVLKLRRREGMKGKKQMNKGEPPKGEPKEEPKGPKGRKGDKEEGKKGKAKGGENKKWPFTLKEFKTACDARGDKDEYTGPFAKLCEKVM